MYKMCSDISSQNILYIFNNPWYLTENEWALMNDKLIENARDYVVNQLERCSKDGFSKIWVTPENQPIAILGFYSVGKKKYETFFIASKHMEACALKISFDLRELLKKETSNYKGCTCVIRSASEHPGQISWFKFLGFTYDPKGNTGNTRYFKYVSR